LNMELFFRYRTSLLLLAITLILGCQTDQLIFKGPYFVRFTGTSLSQKESYSKPISIEVHNGGPALDNDITIAYTIGGNAREGVNYTILAPRGLVTIKKGGFFGNIQVQLINNANNILRSQDIVFTLVTVSTSERQVGQDASGIGKTFTFTILDDCILGGNYIGQKDAISVPVNNITITSQDCEQYTLSNWYMGFFNFTETRHLNFVDNGDNTLTIPDQKESTLPANLASIRGSGIVDPITRKIVMMITLADFQNQPVVSFTLTPD
jgi:hypothetical protein